MSNGSATRSNLQETGGAYKASTLCPLPSRGVDPKNVLAALRSCATDGVLSIIGDETIARRGVKEVWPLPQPTRRVSVSRP